jgi:prepilin-type N-terminal cleavage/methylation domain-containing protein
MKKHTAFTLIELLVVISIIAVLAAILFPVFARAKGAAKKTQAIAYVRQLGLAGTMYASDNDGCFVRDLVQGSDRTYYWWGSFDGSTIRPEEGPLYPYTRSKGVQVDPVFPDSLRTAVGLTGFGYNYAYLSPTDYDANWNPTYRPVSDTQVGSPSETLAFASAARINNWSYGSSWALEGNPFIDPPSFQFPGVHARHAGDRAVAVWVDGHASAPTVGTRAGSFGYGLESQWFATGHLGDVMFGGCPHGSECEDYYYDLR